MKAARKIATAIAGFDVELAAVRERIAALKDEIADVESTPVSVEEALQRLDITMSRIRELEPSVGGFFATDGDHPTLASLGFLRPENGVERAGRALVWLLADLLRDRLQAAIIEHGAKIGATMSAAARAERLKKLRADLLELERREEQLICAGEDLGLAPLRRPDADPRAILNISE